MVPINPDFSCFKSFMSVSFDKVTTGMCKFVFVIRNSNPVGATIAGGELSFPAALIVISAKAQFFDQVKINSTLQFINGMFKPLQK